jgi:hypothetical protein
LLLFALALGCRQEVPPLFRRNQPPETFLTVVPEDSARGFYRYHVYWRGQDPDGRVVRYLFAITDTLTRDESDDWNPELAEDRDRGAYTSKTDSVFLFNAARGRQALHMVAIDDFGVRDRTPARAFFFTFNNGLPRADILDVQAFRDDGASEPRCDAAACTVATFTNFKVRFTGTTANGSIAGFQWSAAFPGQPAQAPQPFGVDSLFLRAGPDTTAFDADGDTLYTLRDNIVTVYYYNRYGGMDVVPPGPFGFSAVVIDEARLPSDAARGRVVVNYDADTRLAKVAACDCPNPPPDCAGDSVTAGWITGFDQTLFTDPSQWILFCDGDTLPQRAHVRFFARGRDDARDLPIDEGGALAEADYSWRFLYCRDPELNNCNRSVPFSSSFDAADYTLPAPAGTPWRGHSNGIGSISYPGLCPFNYRFYASAVDEHGKRDGTPDSIALYVSGAPAVDSVAVPSVVVLVPTCPSFFSGLCPDTTGVRFGPDTLMAVGSPIADPAVPCFLGQNQFTLPFRVWAHDHPRDRRPEISPSNQGTVRAWIFRFNCLAPFCDDFNIGGQNQWRNDNAPGGEPLDRQIFDDPLLIRIALDTLQLRGTGCSFADTRARIPEAQLGEFRFEVQGRDTPTTASNCIDPTSLGPNAQQVERNASDDGRTTELISRVVRLVQYKDVRPIERPNGLAAGAEARGVWAPRKRLSP